MYIMADFHPVLELFDMLSENATQYKGFYSMIAIGGGLSPDSITPFDESSISDYNQGSKPIWSRLDASGETDNSILNMNSIIRSDYHARPVQFFPTRPMLTKG